MISASAQARLGETARRVTLRILIQMQAILQKGEYLAHSSLLENRLIGCQNISVISRKGVWQGTNLETAVKFQKCLTRTFLLVLVG